MKRLVSSIYLAIALIFTSCNSDGNPVSGSSDQPKTFNDALYSGYYGGNDYTADNLGNIYYVDGFSDSISIGNIKLTGGDTYNGFIAKYNKAGNVVWAVALENAQIRGMKLNANGNPIVVGNFWGTLKIKDVNVSSAGLDDIFIAKFSSTGNLLWVKNFGGTGLDEAFHVTTDGEGNILLSGRYGGIVNFDNVELNSGNANTNAFVASLNSAGQLNWVKDGGGYSFNQASSVCTDIDNNVIITGQVMPPASFGEVILPRNTFIFVAKYDKNGKLLWARSFGGYSADTGNSIVTDGYGSIYLAGIFGGVAKFDTYELTPNKQIGTFIVKLSDSGNVLWANQADGVGQGKLTVDNSNNLYFSGIIFGTANFGGTILNGNNDQPIFIAKYKPNGHLQWVEKYDRPQFKINSSVQYQ